MVYDKAKMKKWFTGVAFDYYYHKKRDTDMVDYFEGRMWGVEMALIHTGFFNLIEMENMKEEARNKAEIV